MFIGAMNVYNFMSLSVAFTVRKGHKFGTLTSQSIRMKFDVVLNNSNYLLDNAFEWDFFFLNRGCFTDVKQIYVGMHSNVCEPEAFRFDMINTIISGFQMPDLKMMTSIKGPKDEGLGRINLQRGLCLRINQPFWWSLVCCLDSLLWRTTYPFYLRRLTF